QRSGEQYPVHRMYCFFEKRLAGFNELRLYFFQYKRIERCYQPRYVVNNERGPRILVGAPERLRLIASRLYNRANIHQAILVVLVERQFIMIKTVEHITEYAG